MDNYQQISKAKELDTVLKISQAVSRTLDLDEILEMSCRMTAQALKADRCSIGLLNRAGDAQDIVHTYRRKRSYPSIDGMSFKVIQLPHISQKLKRGRIAHLFSTQKSRFSFHEQKLFRQLNLKIFLAVPIIIDRKPLGAFHLARVENFTPFSPSDINLCQTIANQVGIAIKNANLMQDLRSKYDQQNAILSISQSLFQTLNLQQLFNLITQRTCEILKIDRCSISTFDLARKQATIKSIYLYPKNRSFDNGKHDSLHIGKRYSAGEVPQIYERLRKGRVFVTEDILTAQLAPRARKHFKDVGAKSALILPIFSNGELAGVLSVSSVRNYHQFTDSEFKLCQTIANLASLALENIELMQNLQEKTTKITEQAKSLEKQYREQSILLEISKALSRTLYLDKLFEIVTQKTTELLRIDRCAVALLDKIKGVSLKFKVYFDGRFSPEYENMAFSTKDFQVMYHHLKKKHIFCTSNMSKSALPLNEKKFLMNEGTKSLLVIPFSLVGNIEGYLALSNLKEKHQFTESEIILSQAIANQLSMAIENSQLLELSKKHSRELEKLSLRIINAQEDERKNLAGKLHDLIGQDLTAIKFDLKMCQNILPDQYALIREKLEECEKLAAQSLENVRNLTSDLRPPVLDHFGLVSAIRWYLDSFKLRTNLQIKLKMPKLTCKFNPEFETSIYRMIQEGLTNVAKHSQADRVSISLYKKGNNARIIIQDNGIGFEPEKSTYAHGFGLFRLKENTEVLGGKFKIISNKGRGTKLDISLPWKEKNWAK